MADPLLREGMSAKDAFREDAPLPPNALNALAWVNEVVAQRDQQTAMADKWFSRYEDLREAARVVIGAWMDGRDEVIATAIGDLEKAAGFSQQEGS